MQYFIKWSALYVYSIKPSLYSVHCTWQAGHGRGQLLGKDNIDQIHKSFYVPERSIMHLTVSARFLISSGREGE